MANMVDGCSAISAILLLLIAKVTCLTAHFYAIIIFFQSGKSRDLGAGNPGIQKKTVDPFLEPGSREYNP